MEEITIRDIARICGVGVSTVSRAINNHPDINPETKETIMRVIKENNYVPNNSARNLKRQDAKAIAVLVKGINNSFFSQMIKVLEEEIKEKSNIPAMRRNEGIRKAAEAGEGKKASGHYLSRWLSGSQRGKTGTASCTVYLEHYRNAAKGIQS